jgi:hypothetical protein
VARWQIQARQAAGHAYRASLLDNAQTLGITDCLRTSSQLPADRSPRGCTKFEWPEGALVIRHRPCYLWLAYSH